MTDPIAERLQKCFAVVFPHASPEQIQSARMGQLENWDSMATVTLLAVIEEEFGAGTTEGIDLDDVEQLQSFQNLLVYLRGLVNA
jgi:acyl carrier protein